MSGLTILSQMLHQSRFVVIQEGEATLIENESDATLTSVRISDLPTNAIVLRMDGTSVNRLLRSAKHENRRSDYLIFLDSKGNRFAILIELKSSEANESSTGLIEKFMGTDCIIDYCISVLKRFYNSQVLDGYKRLYVLFYKAPSIWKMPSRFAASGVHDEPEKYRALPVFNYDPKDVNTKVPASLILPF
jgi:hypothetical protein